MAALTGNIAGSWYFAPLSGGAEHGISDAGIEHFRVRGSLARETVQNIGDARNQDSDQPAVAIFEKLFVPAELFPGMDEFRTIFAACRDYWLERNPDGTGNEPEFFEKGLEILDGVNIPMLRIRDENTTGLVGLESESNRAFYRLIRGTGVSALEGVGGGTFGIGQRAPYAYSPLRTVLYSTRTPDGVAFIAKAVLASFEHPDGKKRQKEGWWCTDVDVERDPPWRAIRDEDGIPELFRRERIGTDIYVTGFNGGDWEQDIRCSVLVNFFAAIEADRLVVKIVEDDEVIHEINRENLEDKVAEAAEETR